MDDTVLWMWIALITTVTTIIQTIEMIILVRSNRHTNYLLSHPGELLIALVEQIQTDPKFAAMFQGFIQWLGSVGLAGAKTAVEKSGIKIPKGMGKIGQLMEFIQVLPEIQAALKGGAAGAESPKQDMGGF